MALLYTGRRVNGEEALALGLCDRLVPLAQLRAEAHEFAAEIAASAPAAVRSIRATLRGDLAERIRVATAHERLEQERPAARAARRRQDVGRAPFQPERRGCFADPEVGHPAEDVRVVADRRRHREEEEPPYPASTWQARRRERAHRTGPGVAAERPLGCERGNADHGDRQDIEEDERRPAELSHHVRKAPDVAESCGHSDHGQEGSEAGAERLPPPPRRIDRARQRCVRSRAMAQGAGRRPMASSARLPK